jgi:CBS domain-containing protein
MRIADVIRSKGTDVVVIAPGASVAEVVRQMDERRIGAVVVSTDGGESVAGIVSERDVVHHLHTDGPAVLERPVSEVMAAEVATCLPEDELESLARRMTDLRMRHMPVVVDGRLRAIVSIGDVVKHRLDELQGERDQLVDYVQG